MKPRRALHVVVALLLTGCAKSEQVKSPAGQNDALARVMRAGVLTWGADVVGGVPYVYEDPKRPGNYTGFEMEIAQGIARQLGVKLQLEVKAWDTLIPELQRGSFDMAMNGIEDTPERAKIVLFSKPYYVYSQQLTVRRQTEGISSLADLRGKRVATLSGTAAEDILRAAPAVVAVVAPEITYSFEALENGKVDAVLLDKPIAVAYGASNPKLKNVGDSFEEGRYIIAFRSEDTTLQAAVNQALDRMMSDGQLKAIYERYGIMDRHQAQLGIQ